MQVLFKKLGLLIGVKIVNSCLHQFIFEAHSLDLEGTL